MTNERKPYDVRESITRIFNDSFERCLFAGLTCSNAPIHAHSIQNAAHLGLLERDGHLVQVTRRFKDTGPDLQFGEVGRNRTSTFSGLCGEHDNQLFRPIEAFPIDPDNAEHLFLLAYRAVHRAVYSEMDTAAKVQRAYLERVSHGLEPSDDLSAAGRYATQLLIQAYELYRYKEKLDAAYRSNCWSALVHDVRVLKVQAPSLAVSGFFSPIYSANQVTYTALSVFPRTRSETVIALSYSVHDARGARRHFRSLLRASRARLAYEVSRVVLNSCENFVIAPTMFDLWTEAKRNAILNFFKRTLFVNDWSVENPALNLLVAA